MLHGSIGLHVLLLFKPDVCSVPSGAKLLIDQSLQQATKRHSCKRHALNIQPNHLHLLLECSSEEQAVEVITSVLACTRDALQIYDTGIEVDPAIHVTLLPPWHLEILASFVRDQELYHRNHSVQDEIQNIFLPNKTSNTEAIAN